MKSPAFWHRDGLLPLALSPLAAVTARLTARRVAGAGFIPGVPVICAGNAGVGGSGKTILALDLLARLPGRPMALTRGHGGSFAGPLVVDPTVHAAREVGDEALLLAAAAPTILAHDRAAGARLALARGASAIVMDDGLQNAGLAKTLSFLVVDGGLGFGNGRLLPAGPLRESVAAAAARCRAAVLIGPDETGARAVLPPGLPVLPARLAPACLVALADRPVIAFAGIGRPAKFFASVAALGARTVQTVAFADHHRYSPRDGRRLLARAAATGAILVTTAKDFVKLPPLLAAASVVVTVRLVWDDEAALRRLLP